METTKVLKLYTQRTPNTVAPFPDRDSTITSFKYSAKRMGNAPTISATFLYEECLDDKWSDKVFTVFNGEKYYLRNTPSSSYDNTSCLYKHTLEFVSERVVLESVYFFDVVLTQDAEKDPLTTNSNFPFSGNLHKFAELFNRSAAWSNLEYSVEVDADVPDEEKFIEFQDQFLYDALKKVFEVFDVPFYFVGKKIHIGYAQNVISDPIRYGEEYALISISRNNSGTPIVNRVAGTGSDRNITYYYPNPTPKGWLEANVTKGNFIVNITNQKNFARYVELNAPIDYISPFPVDSHITGIRRLDAFGMTSAEFSDYNPVNGYYSTTGNVNFQLKMDVKVLYTVELCVNLKLNCPENPSIQDAYRIFFEDDPSSEYFANTYIVSSVGTVYKPVIITKLMCNFDVIPTGEYTLYISINNIGTGQNLDRKRWYPTITAEANWVNSLSLKALNPVDSGFEIIGSAPTIGDSFTPNVSLRVNVQNNLMPSIYRETDGLERFYNAENGKYTDEDGNEITFRNPYSETRPREYILRDDEIYPTITGILNAEGAYIDEILDVAYDKFDNDEIYPEGDPNAGKYKHPYFFVKLRKFDGEHGFNLFDHAIENNPMTISMTTGDCGACEFTIGVNDNNKNTVQVDENGSLVYDEDTGNVKFGTPQDIQNDTFNNEVWIALKKDIDTYGVVMPNVENNQYVKSGDKFVILHIDLPDAYVFAAEKRLEDAIIKYMAENNSEKYTYSVKFSRIFFEENYSIAPMINENAVVKLEYNGTLYDLFITSFSFNMDGNSPLPEITAELEEEITIKKGIIEQLREQASDVLKPQLVIISKNLKDNNLTIQTLQASISDTNQTNQLLIEDIQNRLLAVEENTGTVDLTELKVQVQENTQELKTLNETVIPTLSSRLGQAEKKLQTLTETTIPTLSQQVLTLSRDVTTIDKRVTNVEKRVAVKIVTVPTT